MSNAEMWDEMRQERYDALCAANEDDFIIHLDPEEYGADEPGAGPYRHVYLRRRP